MNNESLLKYRDEGFHAIEGWCSEGLFDIIDTLDSVEFNKIGSCLEIGVHHGKFFILLNSIISPQFQSVAIDVFENQFLNIDNSGNGSFNIFKDNLLKFDIHKGTNTRIIQADSTDSQLVEEFKIPSGFFRFISIDGGHTAEHTISDLHLANKLISNEGVVILDDILNYHWLGVIEGVCKFLDLKSTLVPFAIGHNKLFLSKLSWKKKYFETFSNTPFASKIVKFYGHKLIAI